MNYTPLKWTGSKRAFAEHIIKQINKDSIRHYIEPFAGGANVGLKLMLEMGYKIETYTFSDTNVNLIDLWKLIVNKPHKLIESYREHWGTINSFDGVNTRKAYYYDIRTQFNETQSPELFFFLLRTCYNGMVRYNGKGEFNSPYHFSRKGMNPNKVAEIISFWSSLLGLVDVEFRVADYGGLFDVNFQQGTFIFLDPPYINVKKNSLYHGNINHDKLFEGLNNLPEHVSWALTINGNCDLDVLDNVVVEPLESNSSFKRMKGGGSGITTTEKLVLKV